MRPSINLEDIELPSMDTPMAGFSEQACGKSYSISFQLGQPYKGVDEWKLYLPGHLDYGDPWTDPATAATTAKAIVRAQELLDGKNPDLPVVLASQGGGIKQAGILTVVDAKNRQAIQHLIDQATYYGAKATQLWNYWAKEWQPSVISVDPPKGGGRPTSKEFAQSQMPHWELGQGVAQSMFPCLSQPIGGTADWTAATWSGKIQCPTELQHALHDGDLQLFGALIEASMHWARCAEEAAAVVGLHYLNKQKWQDEQGFGIQFAPPAEPEEGPGIADPGPAPEPPLPPEPEPEPPGVPHFDPAPPEPGADPEPEPEDGGAYPEGGPVVPVPEAPVTTPSSRGLSTPVKVGLVLGLGYLAYRALK